jgi:hypothetical protein
MQTQLNHTLFDCILDSLHISNPIKSLSPKGYGTIGENYAAISSHQTAVQYFEIHVIFYRYSTHIWRQYNLWLCFLQTWKPCNFIALVSVMSRCTEKQLWWLAIWFDLIYAPGKWWTSWFVDTIINIHIQSYTHQPIP